MAGHGAGHEVQQRHVPPQHALLPVLGGGVAGRLYPWLSAALLILPACLLLGATFPLLSAGWLRLSFSAARPRWPSSAMVSK